MNITKKSILIILLFFPLIIYAKELLSLSGSTEQGGLIVGKISDEIESVFFDYNLIKVSNNQFVLGFDRDDRLNHIITIVLYDGKMISQRFEIKKRVYDVQEITLPKNKKTYNSKPNLQLMNRINKEAEILLKNRAEINFGSNELLALDKYSLPVQNGRISGVFGSKRVINGIAKKPHNGLDIAAPLGTDVSAMNYGIIKLTGDYYYNGKFVLIDHGSGLSSIYIHLSEISVSIGDFIKTGDKIGEIGNTGRSTGSHLHWGISYKEKRIDPALTQKMGNVFLIISKHN